MDNIDLKLNDIEGVNMSLDTGVKIIEPDDDGDSYEEVILFDGEASTDTITLNDDVSNYTYIEIFFRDNAYMYNSIKIHLPNNKKAVLTVVECNDSDNYFMNFKSKNIAILGNTITNQYYGELNFRMSTKSIYSASRSNVIFITRVIGYK